MDAMDEMEAMVLKTADIQKKRQDTRAPGTGEVQMKGVFKSYLIYDAQLKKNIEDTVPPPNVIIKTSYKDPKKKYPQKLTLQTRVLSFTPVDGQCEPLPNGEDGWRIRSKVAFISDDKGNPEEWLKANYQAFYANKSEYTSRFPISEYIDQEGQIVDYKWVTVYHKTMAKVKVDDREDGIFRRRINGKSSPLVVGPFTLITFSKCTAETYVSLKKDDETGEFVPLASTSIVAKNVDLNEDHDPTLPFTQRLHQQEEKDVHNMIPVADLRAGGHVPYTAYFWVANRYQSPQPCPTGISVVMLRGEELKDYLFATKEKEEPKVMLRFSLFQWKGDTGTNREMYSVKILPNKDDKNMWKNYGILDPKHYAHILLACYNIPCHVSAVVWRNIVETSDSNNPETLNNKPDLNIMRGFYTYGADMLLPDFISYYKQGLAHRVSKARVEREFEAFSSVNRSGNTKITLAPVEDAKDNPLNGKNAALSPVFSIGNGQVEDPDAKNPKGLYHAFDGDLCEVSDDSVFFVLTSHKMTHEELALVQDEARGDAFLDKIIKEEAVYYWFFGIRKKHVSNAELIKQITTSSEKKPKAEEEKPKKKREEEEDPEDHISMEKETPSSSKKAKKPAAGKKK